MSGDTTAASCDCTFPWHAVIPPTHCPKCGRCLGCGQPYVVPYPYPAPYPYPVYPQYPPSWPGWQITCTTNTTVN